MTGRGVAWLSGRRTIFGWSLDRQLRAVAVMIAVLTAAITVGYAVVWWSYAVAEPGTFGAAYVSVITLVLLYGGFGFLLTQRRPRNIAGWLLLVVSGLLAGSLFGESVIDAVLPSSYSTWIGPDLSLAGLVFLLAVVLVIAPLYLPDGRLPSRRWRFVPWVLGAIALTALMSDPLEKKFSDIDDAHPLIVLYWVGSIALLLWIIFAVCFTVLVPFIAVLARFRNTSGIEHEQVKWILLSMFLILASFVFLCLSASFWRELGLLSFIPLGVSLGLLPIAIALAVLRYGLYRIDALIGGAVVYGSVTAALAAGFAVIGGALENVTKTFFGTTSNAGVVATTLILAGAFGPLRRRLQALVDSRLRPPVPREHLMSLRDQLRFTAHAHSPLDLAGQLLDEAIVGFEACGGRISLLGVDGLVIERKGSSPVLEVQVQLPLEADGHEVGLLELGKRRGERDYDLEELRLLGDLCAMVARALATYERAHGTLGIASSTPSGRAHPATHDEISADHREERV